MKQMRIIINLVLIGCIMFLSTGCGGSVSYEDVDISDMLLYEHDNSDFYLFVFFDSESYDDLQDNFSTVEIWIVDKKSFNYKAEPHPIHCATIKEIYIDYATLPLQDVTNECAVIRNAPKSTDSSDIDFVDHDLYILDDEYYLYQYTLGAWESISFILRKECWQVMYESDKETQAKIIEYADYDQVYRYHFGPMYYATPEGQIQCIYKYGNCVYYRQVN